MKKKLIGILLAAAVMLQVCSACGDKNESSALDKNQTSVAEEDGETETAPGEGTEGDSKVAGADEMVTPQNVVEDGMIPVYGNTLKDGVYEVTVDSSSSMFQITNCELTVENGVMTAVMTMGGTGYLYLFMGTGEEAAKAAADGYIPYMENADGAHTYTVPVEALDMGIECAAFSKKKEKWYDRTLLFRADSLPQEAFAEGTITTAEDLNLADGTYQIAVTLAGGSGKTTVDSPAKLVVADGKATATIIFSSSNYDYVLVNNERYEPMNTEGNSTFEIPVTGFDWKMPITADTTAMSTPHEIDYTLYFDSATIEVPNWQGLRKSGSMELSYATQFSVDHYDGGYKLLTIAGQNRYFLVPEDAQLPDGLPEDTVVLQQPISNIYLTATSAMDLFRALDSVEKIRLSGTDAGAWYIDDAREAMERGEILFAGKYSAPDYELILSEKCGLAIESTMIYHTPEVKEQLEKVGVPVLVEYSSYETHPLGRMEWIKLYGALLDKEEEAEQYFDSQQALLEQLEIQEGEKKTVAFFYVTSNGSVNVRKSKDYVAQMLGMAGGDYVFSDLAAEDNALSTETIQMEAFYAAAKDADILIYNSAIDGELTRVDELLAKSSLFSDFKAVKNKNVWCTGKNMFQESTGLCDLIIDFYKVLTKENVTDEELTYLFCLK